MTIIINTALGCYWLNSIRLDNEIEPKKFDLEPEYFIWIVILLFIPVSVFIFILIVATKFLCFYSNKKGRSK